MESTLTGSEKQINWAIDIRKKIMAWCAEFIACYSTSPAAQEKIQKGIDRLMSHTEAHWWIENNIRSTSDYRKVLGQAMQEALA